jgi:hypothetical protein
LTGAILSWLVAAAVLLAAGDAGAQEQPPAEQPPTLVRVPRCDDVRTPAGLMEPSCACEPGAFCLTRHEVDVSNAVATSEARCRVDLAACRDKPPTVVEQGWQTWEVALLTVGVGVAAALAGVGVYALATGL